jgi:phytol kinase
MGKILAFFINNCPSFRSILIGGPVALVWAWCCLWVAGYLKCVKGYKTGYTRKLFHVLTFVTVVIVQLIWGLSAVFIFGAMASLVIFYAVFRGPGYPLYEAMAREADAPHETYYIILPYFATLIGGVVSNILFGPLSIIGYLVVGMGDAAGEPIGTRWGRHVYSAPRIGFGGTVPATRTYEGSLGVLVVSLLALVIAFAVSPQLHFTTRSIVALPLIALGCALVEAVSPHGWDNTSMQIIPVLMTVALL